MTTIIRIKYTDDDNNDDRSVESEMVDKEVLVNINCPIRIILNYIQNVVGLDNTREFDLCDEINCQLRNVSFFEPHTSGLDVLQPDLTYLIVMYERDGNGQITNLIPLIGGKTRKRCLEILSKLRKSNRKNTSAKSGIRRLNTTY